MRTPRRSTNAHDWSHSRTPVGTGNRAPTGTASTRRRDRPRPRARGRRHQVLFEAVARDADPHLRPAVGGAFHDPERKVVEQLVGEDDSAHGNRGQLGAATWRPGPVLGRRHRVGVGVVVGERAERVLDRLERQQRRAVRRGARRSARRARSAAPASTAARDASTSAAKRPRPAPASITRNGSRAPSSSQQRSNARPTSAPKRVPISGLVTKSRPARPAPCVAGEEAAVAVEGLVDERVERDRPFPVDPLRNPLGDRGTHATGPTDRATRSSCDRCGDEVSEASRVARQERASASAGIPARSERRICRHDARSLSGIGRWREQFTEAGRGGARRSVGQPGAVRRVGRA